MPEMSDVLYVGLASQLSSECQVLCACAGLFFARVVSRTEELVELHVAALSRYLNDYDHRAYSRHVRSIILTSEAFLTMLEYDRHLARLATCDLREIVFEYAQSVQKRSTEVSVATDSVMDHPTSPAEEAPDLGQAAFECESVVVPLAIIQELVSVNVTCVPSQARVHRFFLRAALMHLRTARKEEQSWKKRRVLRNQEQRIRRVFLYQDELPMRQLLELTPIYTRGKHGTLMALRMDVDIPVAA
jgi:hypothetical protein